MVPQRYRMRDVLRCRHVFSCNQLVIIYALLVNFIARKAPWTYTVTDYVRTTYGLRRLTRILTLNKENLSLRATLTFKNRASYIYRTGVPLPSRCCILYIFSSNISTEYFKHAAHSPFFSSKCRLFHNATFFGSCIIHILHTGCAKI